MAGDAAAEGFDEDLAAVTRQTMMAMITMTTTAATTAPTMIGIRVESSSSAKPANSVTRHYFLSSIRLSISS